jgi:hypothetical protein
MLPDYCIDLNDQPLVEIGEVKLESIDCFWNVWFSWHSIVGQRLS